MFGGTFALLRDERHGEKPVTVTVDPDSGIVEVEADDCAWAAHRKAVRASAEGSALLLDLAKCAAQKGPDAVGMSGVKLRFDLTPQSAPAGAALIAELR